MECKLIVYRASDRSNGELTAIFLDQGKKTTETLSQFRSAVRMSRLSRASTDGPLKCI